MGFFDKINNSMIVDTFKQFLWNIFHGYPESWYIPQKMLSVSVNPQKPHVSRSSPESKYI